MQERRALLFCKEDRAILCKECDLHIHKANEHTKKHNRFLLTGVQLSSVVASYNYQTSSSSSPTGSAASNYKSCTSSSGILKSSSTVESTPNFQEGSVSTSSISEYLIETLPGWHVEDFLEYPCSFPYGKFFLPITHSVLLRFNIYPRTIITKTPLKKKNLIYVFKCHYKTAWKYYK